MYKNWCFYIFGSSIILGVLPWYTWIISLFSIPVVILDVILIEAAKSSSLEPFYRSFFEFLLWLNLVTIPIFLLIGIFGEIFLIPLGILSPLLFIGSIIGWVVGYNLVLVLESTGFFIS